MRVISCSLQNFASYESLKFDFNDQGLCLIEGPTGSGKSTLCDIIPWILFSKTAKGGLASEVLSWPGDKLTSAELLLSTGETIYRSRGPKAGDNDCFILDILGDQIRGKDLNDTQKLINNLLGFDYDLYMSAAYFHEFSQTAQFFTTTAKNRRAITEQIVDLSLAKKLQINTSERSKTLSKELATTNSQIIVAKSNIEQLERLNRLEATKVQDWEKSREQKLIRLQNQVLDFENRRWAKIDKLEDECAKELKNDVCKECGSIKVKGSKHISNHKAKYQNLIVEEKSLENPHLEYIRSFENEINPHLGASKDFTSEIDAKIKQLNLLEDNEYAINLDLSDLDQLSEVVQAFRAELVKNTITQLENETNKLLTDHFDAEIRVEFDIQEADKLEVNITKDGNQASFTQLSKGQRQLLKLSFGVSVMKAVSNHHGIRFSQIFFDESTDGCDEQTKMKALNLLETLALEYESVFLVEHNEAIKSMINNKYSVSLVNGASVIEKT
jgi:DNA repair exonuclease SbcCD ATPase subunit